MMKTKLKLVAVAFFLLFALWTADAFACSMKLTPLASQITAGDIATFRLERTATHRTCVLPLEQTVIKVTGGEVVDAGVWKKGSPDVLEFKVRLTQPGTATIRIERNCSKDGLQTTQTTVQVAGKPPASPTPANSAKAVSPAQAPSTNPAPPSAVAVEHSAKSGPSLTWQEGLTSWWPEQAAPFLSWLAVFLAGLILFLRKSRSLRKPLLVFSLALTGFYLGGCPCPVGSWYYLLTGNPGMMGLVLFLLAVPVLISFFWGRVFCGWMCPIGAAQELVKVNPFHRALPSPIDRRLRALKYLLLALFSLLTVWTGVNYWGRYDPFKVLFNFEGSAFGFALLIGVMGWSVVADRPFCRYFCPLGAILSVTSRFSLWKIRPEKALCAHCTLCAKGDCCPTQAIQMDGGGKESLPVIDAAECIRCGKCEELCPRKALSGQCPQQPDK